MKLHRHDTATDGLLKVGQLVVGVLYVMVHNDNSVYLRVGEGSVVILPSGAMVNDSVFSPSAQFLKLAAPVTLSNEA